MKLEQAIYIREYLKRAMKSGSVFADCDFTLSREDVVGLIDMLAEEISKWKKCGEAEE